MDAIVIRLLASEDLPEEMTVRVQQMFPNCQKYEKCCRIDKPFWDELEAKLKDIEYRQQPFRLQPLDKFEYKKPPEGFENYNEDIGT